MLQLQDHGNCTTPGWFACQSMLALLPANSPTVAAIAATSAMVRFNR
jgi:hypothetical protein